MASPDNNNQNGGGDRGPQRRFKHMIKINDQIDSMRDAQLHRTSQDISNQFRDNINQLLQTSRRASKQLSNDQKELARASLREQTDQMKASLAQWKEHYDDIYDQMDSAEKRAAKLFYWNRRRDLRDLEREARYRFDDIAEDAEEMSESISSMFQSVGETLRDWGTALNVNSLVNGLEESTTSSRELRIELQKAMNLSDEEWKQMKKTAIEFSKETDYAISNLEFLEGAKDIIVTLGVDDTEVAMAYSKYSKKFEAMTGKTIEDMTGFLESTMRDGFNGAEDVRQIYSQAMALQQDGQFWQTTVSDWVADMQEFESSLYKLSGGDHDKYMALMNQTQAISASTESTWGLAGVDNLLYKIADSSYSDMGDQTAWAALGAAQISQLANSGDLGAAYEMLVTNLQKQMQSIYASTGGNTTAMNEYFQSLGVDGLDLDAKTLTDLATNTSIAQDAFEVYDQALMVIQEQIDADQKFIDTWNPEVTWGEKLKNRWSASAVGDTIGNLLDEMDVTAGELLTYAGATSQILSLLSKGENGGLLGKIPGIGKLFGGGGASATAEGAASGGGLLAGIGNFFKAGFGGAGADTAAGAAGMKILGFGAPGGMATLGTGGALSAGLLTTAATGIAGGVMLAKDAAGGVNKSTDWLGEDRGSSVRGKIESGIGGALGGTGPGVFDEGSALDKAKNVGGGALKGAAIGATIGSVIPGLGTAVGAAVGTAVGAIGSAIGGEKISQAVDWLGDRLGDVWEGTKEIAGKAWDGIKDTASNVWSGITETASNAWDGIKEWGSNAWESVSTTASNVWNGVKDWGSTTWDNITSTASSAWDSVKEWGSNTWDNLKEGAGNLWEKAKNFGIDAMNTAVGAGDIAMENLFGAMGGDWNQFKEDVSQGWDNIKQWGSDTWDNIKTKASETWENAKTTASNVWNNVTSWASSTWDTISGKASEVWNNVSSWASEKWEGIKETASSAWDTISGKASEVWNNVSTWASEKWEGIKETASGAWDAVSTKASEVWDSVSTWAGEKWEGIKETASNAWDSISGKASEIWDSVKEVASSKWDDIKTKASGVWDDVKTKASGVWDEVKEGATKAFNSVKEVAGDIWGGIKDFFTGAKERGEQITGIEGSHRTGLETVPHDGYIAELHKDEAVLTADQADQWRAEQRGESVQKFFSKLYKSAKIDKEALMSSYQSALAASSATESSTGIGSAEIANIKTTGDDQGDIWNFLKSKGLTDYAASGVMGCWQAESSNKAARIEGDYLKSFPGFANVTSSPQALDNYTTGVLFPAYARSNISINKNAYKGSDGHYYPGFGLAQWTGPRVERLKNFTGANNWTSLASQLAFFWQEFTQRGLLEKMNSSSSVAEATSRFFDGFEMYAGASQKMTSAVSKRTGYANAYYNDYKGTGLNPAYEVGTPWVPNDQIALIHEGEMIVPEDYNPNSGNTKVIDTSEPDDDGTIDDLIATIKWGVSRIEKAIAESSSRTNYNLANSTRRTREASESDSVFRFSNA